MALMGVDIGIHKLALACFGIEYHPDSWSVDPELPRAAQLHHLASYAHDLAGLMGIDVVWIEDTLVGNNVKYSIALAETKGAVMAALSDYDVRLVNVGTWKKQVVGAGNANKDAVRDYIHVTHPAYAPLCGDDQDRYDATCIGLYGLQIMERAEGLRLAPG